MARRGRRNLPGISALFAAEGAIYIERPYERKATFEGALPLRSTGGGRWWVNRARFRSSTWRVRWSWMPSATALRDLMASFVNRPPPACSLGRAEEEKEETSTQ